MIGVGRAGFEFPRCVPLPRSLILGVNQEATNACYVSSLCGAQQRVFEQCLAQSFPQVMTIDGQPCQDHDRHRMLGQALHDTCWSILRINASDRQTVEAHYLCTKAAHVGLGTVGFLVNEGIALQKLVEWRLPAVEAFRRIRRRELANPFIRCTQPRTPGSVSSFFKRGLACTGRSSAC